MPFIAFWVALLAGCSNGAGTSQNGVEPGLQIPGSETIQVNHNGLPLNPVDITPPGLNVEPGEIYIDGDYLYVGSNENGINVFDISNPFNFRLIDFIETTLPTNQIFVSDGFLYVAASELQIIDIDPLDSAHIINTIDLPGDRSFMVDQGYAYCCDGEAVYIIDIDPPEAAVLISSVHTPLAGFQFTVSDGVLFIATQKEGPFSTISGLFLYDVSDPENVTYYGKVPNVKYGKVIVSDGYAYIFGAGSTYHDYRDLKIVDIDPLDQAHLVKQISEYCSDFKVSNGYIYLLSTRETELRIYDVNKPEEVKRLMDVPLEWEGESLVLSENYIYIGDGESTIQIVDITSPESAYLAGVHYFPVGGSLINVIGDFGINGVRKGLQIIDLSSRESPFVCDIIELPGTTDVEIMDGYALVTSHYDGVFVVDIDPVESAYVVANFTTKLMALDIEVKGNYAYITSYEAFFPDYLQIFDIGSPNSPVLLKTIEMPHYSYSVQPRIAMVEGYVFMFSDKLRVIDVDPPETAYVCSTIDIDNRAGDLHVYGNYLFQSCSGTIKGTGGYGIQVFDISQPEQVSLWADISTEKYTGISFSGGYTFFSTYGYGCLIAEFYPPQSPSIISSFEMPNINGITLVDNYGYLTPGLHVVKLW